MGDRFVLERLAWGGFAVLGLCSWTGSTEYILYRRGERNTLAM